MIRSSFLPCMLLAALASEANGAATFVVNSTLDVPASADVGDGVCETGPGNGICTLRAAVMEANHVADGGATVVIPAQTYFLTRPPSVNDETDGDLDVLAAMTIVGKGPGATVIDASSFSRVFDVANVPVTMRGLAARSGRDLSLTGGGGGIKNVGDLTLENVTVSSCGSPLGGGIFNNGSLMIRYSTVNGNGLLAGGTAGGGIFNGPDGTLRIEDSLISDNFSTRGGGIYNDGTATIERVLFFGNRSLSLSPFGSGGAVFSGGGTLAISNSTLYRNRSYESGGGIYALGGAIELLHVTISENASRVVTYSSGTQGGGGGIAIAGAGASVVLRGSIVAGNTSASVPDECVGNIVSQDYNLIGKRSTCSLTGNTTHVNTTDNFDLLTPLLKPGGGFALDRSALAPAVEAIPAESCTDLLGAPLLVDQRGYARTPPCDIGATENGAGYGPAELRGVELIRNGGAEGNEVGGTKGAEVEQPPFWGETDRASMTQINYGLGDGYPLASEAPPGSGAYFFAGGAAAFGGGAQRIDLSPLATEIDAGSVAFTVSGAFGGFFTDEDFARLALFFYNADSEQVATLSIGGFSAADRGNLTLLVPDSEQGIIPTGTRFVDVELEMTRINGAGNDGYADNLSLVLPEPSSALLGVAAIAAMLSLRAREARSSRR